MPEIGELEVGEVTGRAGAILLIRTQKRLHKRAYHKITLS